MRMLRILTGAALLLGATLAMGQSGAQSSFERMKSLAGSWQGKGPEGKPLAVSYRVVANGSAVMSEIGEQDMITMFHLDRDRLLMTHYCGAGNQPRMRATASPDGNTIRFDFVDATNLADAHAGHMHRLVLNLLDPNHHTEEWSFQQNGKEMTERFDLYRKPPAN